MNKTFTLTATCAAVLATAGAIAMKVLAADAPASAAAAGGKTADYAVTKDYVSRASQPASGDWTMWGGTPHRNMISAEKNPPTEWDVGDKDDPKDDKNVRWEAPLGSKAYGNPIVANGKVFVGT